MQTWTRPDDKAKLPPGPWQDEPDKAVWIDDATGLDCMINRGPRGALCGYVGVGPDHPLHGMKSWDLWDRADDITTHAELNYSEPCDTTDEDPSVGICHVPEPGRPHDVHWLGFDCAHAYDIAPAYDLAPDRVKITGAEYRSFDYVHREVTQLASQLAAIHADT